MIDTRRDTFTARIIENCVKNNNLFKMKRAWPRSYFMFRTNQIIASRNQIIKLLEKLKRFIKICPA